jgi:hypothetical protein
MRNKKQLAMAALLAGTTALLAWGAQGCGSDDSSAFPDGGILLDDAGNPIPGDGSCAPFCNTDGSTGADVKACTNLCLQQTVCGGGAKTTISGVVYDPAGAVPLYNVVVYVPNAPVSPITSGATCDTCGAMLSGSPLVATQTNYKGEFKLENMPVGANIPVVIQVGKWRRQIVIPTVTACVDNPIADKNLTRLPRNKAEGDIPLIALTTGGADPLECLPKKMGIDVAEFTAAGGTGRIQLYQGVGGATIAGITPVMPLWTSVTNLKKYDMVLLGCEGGEHNENKGGVPTSNAIHDYTEAGGRVFGTHFHYTWLENGPADFKSTATFAHPGNPPNPSDGYIDTSFAKGQAFADWMTNAPTALKSNPPPIFTIVDPRHDVSAVNNAVSTRWVYNTPENVIYYYSFNAPVNALPAAQCGKFVFSDLHVGAGGGQSAGKVFPAGCPAGPLSPQERALEFLLFDLSSCIQNDKDPPPPPPVLPN